MAEQIAVIDVVVPAVPVVSVASVGMAGPPGAAGPAGPAGPQGPAGTAGPHQATHAVGGSDPVTGPLALNPYVSVGVNPSQSGAVRLGNSTVVMERNAANTADVPLIQSWSDDKVYVGAPNGGGLDNGLVLRSHVNVDVAAPSLSAPVVSVGVNPSQGGSVRLPNTGSVTARNAANTGDVPLLATTASNSLNLGGAGIGWITIQNPLVVFGTYLQIAESTSPGPAPANHANVWVEDNGAGKSRLMCRFPTGAAVQIAIEP